MDAGARADRAADIAAWLVVASLLMFLASLVSGYVLLRAGSETWPTPWLRDGARAFDDPWVRLIGLVVAAAAAAASARGLPHGPGRVSRYPLPVAAFAGAVFTGRTIVAGDALLAAGHTPASHVAVATWFALNGVLAVLCTGAVAATIVVNLGTWDAVVRTRRSRALARVWTLLAAAFAVVAGGMYLI
jgi:heme/copper-type cytochrome/quinol oxidase subunit 3